MTKPGLSVERVVQAGIELADADGLAAVSMARVARRLGFTTMSLYRHVRDKDELLMRMLDAGLGVPTEPEDPGEGWRPGLERWCWELLAKLERHPWALRINIAGQPMAHNQLRWLDRGLRALAATGLTEAEKADVVLLVNGYTFWEARLFDDIAQGPASGPGPLPPVDLPALGAALAAGIFEDGIDRDAHFTFGLERVLDGVAQLIAQR